MVLAEEDAFKIQLIQPLPQRDTLVIDDCRVLLRGFGGVPGQRVQEFENPRLDHAFPRP